MLSTFVHLVSLTSHGKKKSVIVFMWQFMLNAKCMKQVSMKQTNTE